MVMCTKMNVGKTRPGVVPRVADGFMHSARVFSPPNGNCIITVFWWSYRIICSLWGEGTGRIGMWHFLISLVAFCRTIFGCYGARQSKCLLLYMGGPD